MAARKLFLAEIQVFSEFFVFLCNCNWFALTAALSCDHRTTFDVKKLAVKNNKSSRWAPLALALAVSAAVPAAYADDAIHIQAQSLGAALSQLGQQTSLQVFFSPDMVAGKQAPAVDGNLSPEQALRQLLQGSGLDYQIDAGSVTLRPQSTAATNGPLELGVTDIKVVGDWLGDADAAV